MEDRFDLKIYYEDTDCAGVVYYANYLRFFERARTELIDRLGRSVVEWTRDGFLFVVYKIDVTYRRPATLGDRCEVITKIEPNGSEYRMHFRQTLVRGDELLTTALVQLVCLNREMAVQRFPAELLALAASEGPEVK